MKIKNFVKFFKEGALKYFKISMKFLSISKWNISSCIPLVVSTFNDIIDLFDNTRVCKIILLSETCSRSSALQQKRYELQTAAVKYEKFCQRQWSTLEQQIWQGTKFKISTEHNSTHISTNVHTKKLTAGFTYSMANGIKTAIKSQFHAIKLERTQRSNLRRRL